MVLNVSGRTDIVAFYMDWFLNRLDEGYFLIRNPYIKNLVHRIDYDDVDMIMFCTKNPTNLLKNLDKIDKPFVVHVTLTPYGKDIEPYVPDKKHIIETIRKMSRIIGPDRIFVRYDPIFLSEKYDIDYHIKSFKKITQELCDCTKTIIVSFIDEYKNVYNNKDSLNKREFTEEDYRAIGENFSFFASESGMTVQTCGEQRTLFEYGFVQEDCINEDLVYKACGKTIKERWNSRNNKNCHCIKMYDIGDYNSCKHYCKYCYANYNERDIKKNVRMHDVTSPILIGQITSKDEIKKNSR